MIFKRQNLVHRLSGSVLLPELRTLENGTVELVDVDQSKSNLPDVETTRLCNVLEAGVDLRQVPSKVIASTDPINLVVGSDDSRTDDSQTQIQTQE